MHRSQAEAAVTAGVAVSWCACQLAGAPTAVLAVLGTTLLGCPGYVWCEVLLGRGVRGLERAAVAAGLAFALPVLGGLALQVAGVPLRRPSWAALLVVATLAGDAVLVARRGAEGPARAARPRWPQATRGHGVIFGAAAVIALGAVAVAWEGARLQPTPGFTQLWLVPARARPELASLGVSNHQGRQVQYELVLQRHGQPRTVWHLVLADGQTWQRTVTMTAGLPASAFLYQPPDLRHPFRQVTENVQVPAP